MTAGNLHTYQTYDILGAGGNRRHGDGTDDAHSLEIAGQLRRISP